MEIMHTSEFFSDGAMAFMALFIIIISIAITVTIVTWEDIADKILGRLIPCIIVIILCASAIFYIAGTSGKVIQHEVVITNMDAFDFEKYEVIGTKGKIFTIKEKRVN